jgi:hypothetical protein
MPDLAYSKAGNINNSWTVQQLVQSSANLNLGYDTKAPVKAEEPETEKEKVESDGE